MTNHRHDMDERGGNGTDDHGNDYAGIDALRRERRDDPDGDFAEEQWNTPRSKSRWTAVLVVVLLLAVGFLLGVYAGRAGLSTPQRGGGTAAATSGPVAGGGGDGTRFGSGAYRAF